MREKKASPSSLSLLDPSIYSMYSYLVDGLVSIYVRLCWKCEGSFTHAGFPLP